MAKDYYQVLGIEKTEDQALIKKAYRDKAKSLHPDKSKDPNTQMVFQELNEAYMVLSDPEKKSKYDRGSQMPVLSEEQVRDILRKRHEYYWDRDSIFKYQGNNVYPPTDYQATKKYVLIANLIIAAFAIVFLVDLSFKGKVNPYEVRSVYYVYSGTQDVQDFYTYKVFIGNMEIYLSGDEPPVAEGEEVYITNSFVFQKPYTFDTADGKTYNISGRAYVLWLSLIILLVSIIGTTPALSPERQFNAAVISGFFSVLLIISLIFI